MSFRATATGWIERLAASGAGVIPQYSSGSTMMVWCTQVTDRNAETCPLLLRGDLTTGQYTGIYTGAGGDSPGLDGSYGTVTPGPKLFPAVQPTVLAYVCAPPTITAYMADRADAAVTQVGQVTPSADMLPDMVRLGNDGFGSFFLGNINCFMSWSRVLSTSEINVQRRSRTPIDRRGLLQWLPCHDNAAVAGNLKDYSGLARDFVANGTPSAQFQLSQTYWRKAR